MTSLENWLDSSERVLETKVSTDAITDEISKMFDYAFDGESSFTVPSMPSVPVDFGLGLIVGPSGSGKTSLLAQFGAEEDIHWDQTRAAASHFESASEAAEKFAAVGFNSVPSWLRPYHVLSTGERFRADLARRLKNGAVIDEFTSVVDRAVAKSCANALSRYAKKTNLRGVVLASCHYDIVEWLQPDWTFDTMTGLMAGRGLHRPDIVIDLVPCTTAEWAIFSHHHYLNGDINKSSRCWLASWNGVVVGFTAALAFPNRNFSNAWRGHRTVVLPDFQGLGIGVRISDAVGAIFASNGCRYFSKTAHPRLGEYREHSSLWKPTTKNKKSRPDYVYTGKATKEDKHKNAHKDRLCFSHEYVGSTDLDFAVEWDSSPQHRQAVLFGDS